MDWIDKSCTLTQESTFVTFNFTGASSGTLSQWTMDKLGYTVDPYNVAVNGSAFQHSKWHYKQLSVNMAFQLLNDLVVSSIVEMNSIMNSFRFFTGVCHSVHGGGGGGLRGCLHLNSGGGICLPRGSASWGGLPTEGVCIKVDPRSPDQKADPPIRKR